MAKLPVDKMRELERRFGEVEARMSDGPSADVYVRLAAEYAELQPVVARIRDWERAIGQCERFADEAMRFLEAPRAELVRPL